VHLFPEFVRLKRGSLSIFSHRALTEGVTLKLLLNPDLSFGLANCRIIKDQLKIKVARVKIEIRGELREVYIKRYNAFSWRYRLGSLFRSSGAAKSLRGAAILAELGIRTATPLAVVESRPWGMLSQSFYLSEEIEKGETADVYWRDALSAFPGAIGFLRRHRFLDRLGKLFSLLHQNRIYHNDLKDANIIVSCDERENESFHLLDLEGVRVVWPLTIRRRIKNLVQLNRTFGKYLSTAQRLYLLKSYLGADFFNRDKKRFWVRKIIKQTQRGDEKSLRKMRRKPLGFKETTVACK